MRDAFTDVRDLVMVTRDAFTGVRGRVLGGLVRFIGVVGSFRLMRGWVMGVLGACNSCVWVYSVFKIPSYPKHHPE